MAATLSKVVLIGASGTIGTHILAALLSDPADNFTVTILTRPDSTSTFPVHPSVTVVRVSHDDIPGLTDAFRGHDAIAHAGGIPSISSQPLMIEAAVVAGVSRFVLNEFANSPITQVGLRETERFRKPRVDVAEVAKRAAAENPGFSWTGLCVGNILDLSLLKFPQFGIDIRGRKVKYTDEGRERITAVTLPDIGVAVRGILRAPAQTRNRYGHIRSVETDQVGIVGALEELQEVRYGVSRESSEVLYERGKEGFARGERSGFHDLLVVQLFGRVEGKGSSVLVQREESDNSLLGVREKDVREIVAGVLESLREEDGGDERTRGGKKDVLGEARSTMG